MIKLCRMDGKLFGDESVASAAFGTELILLAALFSIDSLARGEHFGKLLFVTGEFAGELLQADDKLFLLTTGDPLGDPLGDPFGDRFDEDFLGDPFLLPWTLERTAAYDILKSNNFFYTFSLNGFSQHHKTGKIK